MARQLTFILIIFSIVSLLSGTSHAEQRTIEDKSVVVTFDIPLQNAAYEVLGLYPAIHAALAKDLGWRSDFRPEIILVKDATTFRSTSESNLVIAYAIPRENLIVIDYTRMNAQPFTLGTTLKHELCHLELHRHIASLPRWFDEGVCQWVTGGMAEIMNTGGRSIFIKSALLNRLISFERLTETFPTDGEDLILAYEESKSVIEYIKREFGDSAVRHILEHMSKGDDLQTAIRKSLSISQDELEKRWRASITTKTSLFSYVGDNLYEILFVLAALITFYGFLRVLKKKREYKDEEKENEEGDERNYRHD